MTGGGLIWSLISRKITDCSSHQSFVVVHLPVLFNIPQHACASIVKGLDDCALIGTIVHGPGVVRSLWERKNLVKTPVRKETGTTFDELRWTERLREKDRTIERQNDRTTERQNNGTTEQQNNRTTERQNNGSTERQDKKTMERQHDEKTNDRKAEQWNNRMTWQQRDSKTERQSDSEINRHRVMQW